MGIKSTDKLRVLNYLMSSKIFFIDFFSLFKKRNVNSDQFPPYGPTPKFCNFKGMEDTVSGLGGGE